MDAPQAKAFARAFQLGMTRALQHCATKEDLRYEMDKLRAEMHREIGSLRDEMHREIASVRGEIGALRDEVHREIDQLRADIDRRFRVLYWILGVGFGGMFALMAAILVRL